MQAAQRRLDELVPRGAPEAERGRASWWWLVLSVAIAAAVVIYAYA